MNRQICRLKIRWLSLTTENGRLFVAVTLARGEPDAAGDEVANQLWNKSLVHVLTLLAKLLELVNARRNFLQLTGAGIEPEHLASRVG
jgi:hypothetical protein